VEVWVVIFHFVDKMKSDVDADLLADAVGRAALDKALLKRLISAALIVRKYRHLLGAISDVRQRDLLEMDLVISELEAMGL
jgi:hypothetical protein